MVRNLLIKGNIKMGKKGYVYLFNLPPKITCTPTRWCLAGKDGKPACYAFSGNFTLPNVINGAKERYKISQQDDFAERMISEIHKKGPRYFRFHASGDFYSDEYVEKVIMIAEECPDTMFRTTTRRRDLTDVILKLNSLPNFVVRESLDTERPVPVMGLPYAALDHLAIVEENGPYHCMNYCPDCGYHCWESRDDISFGQH